MTELLDKMSYFEGLALVVVAPVPDLFDDTFRTTQEVTQSWKGLCAKHWPWVAFVDSQEVLRGGVDDPLPDFTFLKKTVTTSTKEERGSWRMSSRTP